MPAVKCHDYIPEMRDGDSPGGNHLDLERIRLEIL